jgi:hypothetical protein
MTLACLRDDALSSTSDGFRLLLSLPWIRSLPLWSLRDLTVTIDGTPASDLRCVVDGRAVPLADLGDAAGWWFLQERLAVLGPTAVAPGAHEVTVAFRLTIPYLPGGPDSPLTLPFHDRRTLAAPAASSPARTEPREAPAAPADRPWRLAASAFNWTPDVIRAERSALDIAVGIVESGVASTIELEPGQLWPSFPDVTAAEAGALRTRLAEAGGAVSIVGASLDDWTSPTRRRSEDERLAFLVPQLHAAKQAGAEGVRLPVGQAGPSLLGRLLPMLHELGITLYEEVQGQQPPTADAYAAAYHTVADLDDPRLRLLVDISMLMPALPVTYLDRLEAAGIPSELHARLRDEWKEPATQGAVVDHLRSGGVAPEIHALYMDMIVRFGRSEAADLRDVLPLVGAIHLKFWDLDDSGGRVSAPIRDIAAELRRAGFAGTLCSEWGGHEWLDADAADMTRRHLALAATALATAPVAR